MKASYYNGNKSFSVEPAAVVEPGTGEVCIKVAYCGLCGTDLHIFHGDMDARVGPPRIIGHEMSGTVQSIGAAVTDLAVGDAVVVRPLVPCNDCHACARGYSHVCQKLMVLGVDAHGALQQSWTVPAHTVHKLPVGISLRHAALVEPAAVACHDVTRSRLTAGEDALVIGGGPIGVLIAMVARHKGANVIISEVNTHRLQMAEKLGFETINPTTCDVGETVYRATANKGADVVFEVSGSQAGVDCMTKAAAVRCCAAECLTSYALCEAILSRLSNSRTANGRRRSLFHPRH